jgi:hypothetical protein
VSQSSEFCGHKPLCCFLTSVYCCKRIFHYDSVRKLLDTPSYTFIHFLYKKACASIQVCLKGQNVSLHFYKNFHDIDKKVTFRTVSNYAQWNKNVTCLEHVS